MSHLARIALATVATADAFSFQVISRRFSTSTSGASPSTAQRAAKVSKVKRVTVRSKQELDQHLKVSNYMQVRDEEFLDLPKKVLALGEGGDGEQILPAGDDGAPATVEQPGGGKEPAQEPGVLRASAAAVAGAISSVLQQGDVLAGGATSDAAKKDGKVAGQEPPCAKNGADEIIGTIGQEQDLQSLFYSLVL